ncbi:hypothetical protein C7M52_00236 [Mixta theicola]|nr:hypothetical protein [Mixta theicola]QHM74312.1 hypothetical protein C7M52_00236 [Mixta theicola]
MNGLDIEEDLVKNGFTSKDLAVMREYLRRDGTTYLILLHKLRSKFLVMLIIILLIMAGIVYTINFESGEMIYSYIAALCVAVPIVCLVKSVRLGYKAFIYKIKE